MLPLRHEVGLHSYSAGGIDGYGCTIPVYTPPRESPGIVEKVYGWVVSSSTEPHVDAGRSDLVVTDVELFASPDFQVSAYDLIDLPDGQYEVMGQPEDYTRGPFGSALGVLVKLRRVEG
jgi:hypothetical protein